MSHILDQAVGAFPGMTWLLALVIAIIAALLTGRLPQVIIWALVALFVFTFWPIVVDAISHRSLSGAGPLAQQIVKDSTTAWVVLLIRFAVFIVGIGAIYLLRSLFRRA